jgi:polyferredoxin
MTAWIENVWESLEAWAEAVAANVKLVDQALTGMEGSYVELLTLLALALLAAMPLIVPEKRRQVSRRLAQVAGILIFIFIVYTCMGVFGMVRNLFRGLSEIGRENIIALYFCSVPVMVLATSLIFGPMFCGWICPTGALQEFAALVARRWHARRRSEGWKFSWWTLGLSLAGTALFFLWLARLSETRVFFVEDSSIYWAEVLLILQFVLLWKMKPWDRPLRRLRRVSLAVIVVAAVAGWWVTSPVHLVFTKVYDPASLLSTVIVLLAALVVPQAWCRYLCPWREVIAWTARHSVRRLETVPGRCRQCGTCETVCGVEAIRQGRVEMRECHMCLRCVDHCPSKAIQLKEQWKAEQGEPNHGNC